MLAVVAIVSASWVYSTLKRMQLSDEVQAAERAACARKGGFDCDLIAKYHDECFESSYRAEYRIRSFHDDEYRVCIESRMSP